MPTLAAASAHCVLRCSVGTTTVICSTTPSASSSPATRRANAVLPEPGVATARKSRGWAARYRTNARRCQLRKAWVSGAALARTQDSSLIGQQPNARDSGCASRQDAVSRSVDEEVVVADEPLQAFLVGEVRELREAFETVLSGSAGSKQLRVVVRGEFCNLARRLKICVSLSPSRHTAEPLATAGQVGAV